MAEGIDEEIQMEPTEALQYLTGGGDFYQFRTKMALKSLEKYAKEMGLDPGQITSLVATAGSGRLGSLSSQKLIRCLIPREHVEQEAAVKIFSCLGVPNTTPSVKAMLLKWTVLVFDLLDGDDLLTCLYDVLFHFLDYDSLRPTVCQLLCFITRREHVMEFRIHKLLRLLKSVGVNDQPVVSLLWAFKVYRPDLLSVSMKSGRKALFKSVDRSLAADIKRVQAKRTTVGRLAKSLQTTPPSKRRKLIGILPGSTTLAIGQRDSDTVSVSQLSSVDDLVENLEKVELPSQMASSLQSPIVRHLLSVTPDRDAAVRLTFWLEHCIGEVFLSNSPDDSPEAEEMLQCLVSLTEFLQDSITAVQYYFLCGYLPVWNGIKYRSQILQLVAYLRPEPFEDFRRTYIKPIHRLFFTLDVFFKADVLQCWRQLLYNLLTPDWTRREGVFGSLMMDDQDVNQVGFIRQFVEYVDGLCSAALQVERSHPLIQSSVLSFYDAVCDIYQKYGVPVVALPSPSIVCRSMFPLNASGTAGMCRLLVKYAPSFRTVRRKGSQQPFENNVALTNQLNCYIMDVCNALWRSSAFRFEQGLGTLLYDIPKEALSALRLSKVNDTLMVNTSVAFLGLLWGYLQVQQKESENNFHPRNMTKMQRLAFLDFLKEHHMEEISDFVRTFITIKK